MKLLEDMELPNRLVTDIKIIWNIDVKSGFILCFV